jgi:hypothetical protein
MLPANDSGIQAWFPFAPLSSIRQQSASDSCIPTGGEYETLPRTLAFAFWLCSGQSGTGNVFGLESLSKYCVPQLRRQFGGADHL